MIDSSERPKKAVALFYDGVSAPTLSAKGAGDIAEEIIALPKEHDIPIHEEPDLVNLLARLKLGEEIPRELYIAVAEVIAFAYIIKGKMPERPSENRKCSV
jgi:flagellar biosynthesis protein